MIERRADVNKGGRTGQMALDFKGSGKALRDASNDKISASPSTSMDSVAERTDATIHSLGAVRRERAREILREQLVRTGIISKSEQDGS